MEKNFEWQAYSVSTLRNTVRRLRRRAILFKHHHYGTRQTKQDLVGLLEGLFWLVRDRDPFYHLHHRRLRFELYCFRGTFYLDPQCKEPL